MKTLVTPLSMVLMLFSTIFGYSRGSGTAEQPYQISTVDDLVSLGLTVSDWDKHFILTTSLDISGTAITPIGGLGGTFTGSFDGGGHTLFNLTIVLPDNESVALFGVVMPGAEIKNLYIQDINITGRTYVAPLAAYNRGTISNCHTENGQVNGVVTAAFLVAWNDEEGLVEYCSAKGSALADNEASATAGGLVAKNDAVISQCYADGNATACSDGNFGRPCAGGLVGENNKSTIQYCYATGNASATCLDDGAFAGGLVGLNSSAAIIHCYATGSASATAAAPAFYEGALCGINTSYGRITASFWNTSTSSNTSGCGYNSYIAQVTGLNNGQMKLLNPFISSGWDFSVFDGDAVDWQKPQNDFPRLPWQGYADYINLEWFAQMASFWLVDNCAPGQVCSQFDYNSDGVIDFSDLLIITESFTCNHIVTDDPVEQNIAEIKVETDMGFEHPENSANINEK